MGGAIQPALMAVRTCGWSHPGIRQAAARVERRQEAEPQVFGHVQELVLVPLHVLPAFLQHHGHGVTPQQASAEPDSTFTGERETPAAAGEERLSPQDPDVGFKDRNHDVVVQPHV